MHKRAFLFGCSFTRHIWPTWADMLQYYNPNIEVFNFSRSGIGNVGISHRIVESDVKYNLNEDDLIIIVWTYFNRKDLFKKGDWFTEGNIFNSEYYDKNYINKYWTVEHSLLENFGSIILSNKSYNISDQYCTIPLINYCKYDLSHQFLSAKDLFGKLQPIEKFNFSNNSNFNGLSKDNHPDIDCQISFYNNYIAKKNNLAPIPKNNVYSDHQNEIIKILKTLNTNDLSTQSHKIIEYFEPLRSSSKIFGSRY